MSSDIYAAAEREIDRRLAAEGPTPERHLEYCRDALKRAERQAVLARRELTKAGGPKQRKRAAARRQSLEWDGPRVERRILREHGQGLSLHAIAAGLNEDGVPTARGRTWYAMSVSNVIKAAS